MRELLMSSRTWGDSDLAVPLRYAGEHLPHWGGEAPVRGSIYRGTEQVRDRSGHRVRLVAVAKLLQALHQSQADNSLEHELRSWLAPDLLILDDFGGRKLSAQQSILSSQQRAGPLRPPRPPDRHGGPEPPRGQRA